MKTIVVTGTSSGIGYQICIEAAKMNFHVISVSRNIEPLKDIGGIESFAIDITNKAFELSLIHISEPTRPY